MSTTTVPSEPVAGRRRRTWPAELNAAIGLIVLCVVFEVLGWIFVKQSFLANPLRLSIMITQVAVVGILAIGVTQVIIAGGIDLSGGSIIGVTAMIAMSFAQSSVFPGRYSPSRVGLTCRCGSPLS